MNESQVATLSRAVRSWLAFQCYCGRGALLSEAYLTQPVGEFLNWSNSGDVRAEWNHPNIPHPERGRPRQIDYVVRTRDSGQLAGAIEVKWVSDQGGVDRQRIVDDLLRLECVRNEPGPMVWRYFLLAGRDRDIVANFMQLQVNTGVGSREEFHSYFLDTARSDSDKHVSVFDCPRHMRRFFKSFGDSYKVSLPRSYKTKCVASEEGDGFRVLAWRVSSSRRRAVFSPIEEWPDETVPDVDDEDTGRGASNA